MGATSAARQREWETGAGCKLCPFALWTRPAVLGKTAARPQPEAHAGARERLRAWLRAHPYTVVLAQEGNEPHRHRA